MAGSAGDLQPGGSRSAGGAIAGRDRRPARRAAAGRAAARRAQRGAWRAERCRDAARLAGAVANDRRSAPRGGRRSRSRSSPGIDPPVRGRRAPVRRSCFAAATTTSPVEAALKQAGFVPTPQIPKPPRSGATTSLSTRHQAPSTQHRARRHPVMSTEHWSTQHPVWVLTPRRAPGAAVTAPGRRAAARSGGRSARHARRARAGWPSSDLLRGRRHRRRRRAS